ncbi:MAG: polysaccharide biosynthesis/export family protein [Candidatus Auribacterota bacterium]|jgi:polysaccharide export outer membrane protein|nr:polysaccharide biosynthesis/export family protein [Candidatus Auribacterota bacterium]
MNKKIISVISLGVCCLLFSGCNAFNNMFIKSPRVEPRVIVPEAYESIDYERPMKSDIRGEYIIEPSDAIRIVVRNHPNLSGVQVVRPDGRITLELIDELVVTGLTPKQVDDLLTEELKRYIKDVNVSVSVVGFNSKNVYYIGPTGNAIMLPYTGEMTVLDLISRIGGVPQTAAPENTLIVRGDLDEPQMIKVNLKDIIYRGDYKDNILLRESDVVILPANFFSKVSDVVANFTRGVNAPASAINAVNSNMSAIRTFEQNAHRWDIDTPFDFHRGEAFSIRDDTD